MTKPAQPVAAPQRFNWRRLFQYSLRTLLIVVTLFAGFFAWWSNSAQRQREAVAALRSVGARITYDFQDPVVDRFREPLDYGSGPPYWPSWLVSTLGVDYFANVDYVELPEATTDTDLEHLRGIKKVAYLELGHTQVTDIGLKHIQSLTSIRGLGLSFTNVTDNGLENLKGLVNLQDLDLKGTKVSDSGLVHLRGLTSLHSLQFLYSRVTNVGIDRLEHSLPKYKNAQ